MKLIMLNKDFDEYLKSTQYVDYNEESIKLLQEELFDGCNDEVSKIQRAYYFVRDNILHS